MRTIRALVSGMCLAGTFALWLFHHAHPEALQEPVTVYWYLLLCLWVAPAALLRK